MGLSTEGCWGAVGPGGQQGGFCPGLGKTSCGSKLSFGELSGIKREREMGIQVCVLHVHLFEYKYMYMCECMSLSVCVCVYIFVCVEVGCT